MNSFVNAVKNTPTSTTFNGDNSYEDTGSSLLDYFVLASRRGADVVPAFKAAFEKDAKTALRIWLWARDARGGQGERKNFRDVLEYLARESNVSEEIRNALIALVPKIVEVGRWDDLHVMINPLVEETTLSSYIADYIKIAIFNGDRLAAKWTPREGTLKGFFRRAWGFQMREYRQFLAQHTEVVETKMSARKWNQIKYSSVPSRAHHLYKKAFARRDIVRYNEYVSDLKSGKETIKSSVLFPYEIISQYVNNRTLTHPLSVTKNDITEAQWEALPDFLENCSESILPMIDTSGSMLQWDYYTSSKVNMKANPLSVAMSLGIYAAERQKSVFKDLVLSFSDKPKFSWLKGPLSEKVKTVLKQNINYYNTDIRAAFDVILEYGNNYDVPAEEMPSVLLILSDMEFDSAIGNTYKTAIQYARDEYKKYDYLPPKIIFWTINGFPSHNPVRFDEYGTAIVSGFSPSLFKTLIGGEISTFTPFNMMKAAIDNPRYDVKGVTV